MKQQLKYLELKTGYAHNGPAWIAYVEFSKSGKTIYFNGKALTGNGHGICSDLVTHEIYWVSGIKKNGEDRHWLGNGKIQIDKSAVNEYLQAAGLKDLDPKKYNLVEIPKNDKGKFGEIENRKFNDEGEKDVYHDLNGMTESALGSAILELKDKESNTNPNNGLKFYTSKREEAERRLTKMQDVGQP